MNNEILLNLGEFKGSWSIGHGLNWKMCYRSCWRWRTHTLLPSGPCVPRAQVQLEQVSSFVAAWPGDEEHSSPGAGAMRLPPRQIWQMHCPSQETRSQCGGWHLKRDGGGRAAADLRVGLSQYKVSHLSWLRLNVSITQLSFLFVSSIAEGEFLLPSRGEVTELFYFASTQMVRNGKLILIVCALLISLPTDRQETCVLLHLNALHTKCKRK